MGRNSGKEKDFPLPCAPESDKGSHPTHRQDPHPSLDSYLLICILFIFQEEKGGKKRGGETSMCLFLWCAPPPQWGHGLQPRWVPWLGIELATLWFVGQHWIHWATPARAYLLIFKMKRLNQQVLKIPYSSDILEIRVNSLLMCLLLAGKKRKKIRISGKMEVSMFTWL